MSVWVFGYGSLIWRPDFAYLERRRARLHGWQRRFWQGSHDHRGVPDRPGRVVTLVPSPDGHCDGMAYLVDDATAHLTFEVLDHREKNGYERHEVMLEAVSRVGIRARESAPTTPFARVSAPTGKPLIPALVYIAAVDNHAYLGPAPLPEMARQIAQSTGPSGANRDYLLDLARALRAMGTEDPHVFELEAAVLEHAT